MGGMAAIIFRSREEEKATPEVGCKAQHAGYGGDREVHGYHRRGAEAYCSGHTLSPTTEKVLIRTFERDSWSVASHREASY